MQSLGELTLTSVVQQERATDSTMGPVRIYHHLRTCSSTKLKMYAARMQHMSTNENLSYTGAEPIFSEAQHRGFTRTESDTRDTLKKKVIFLRDIALSMNENGISMTLVRTRYAGYRLPRFSARKVCLIVGCLGAWTISTVCTFRLAQRSAFRESSAISAAMQMEASGPPSLINVNMEW